ncbi:MAG: helix-turn-helix domain-containing protein [Alphaproteobacteria bacterium]
MREAIVIIREYSGDNEDLYISKLSKYFSEYAVVLPPYGDIPQLKLAAENIITIVIDLGISDVPKYLDLISALNEEYSAIPIILLLPYGSESFAQKAVRVGAHDFLIKPVAAEKLRLCLEHAITIRHLRKYITRLEQHISTQSGITLEEQQSIMLTQMQHFLVDENGNIKPLHILEQEIIASVLHYSGGCISRAARSLGIGRSTLYRKVDNVKGGRLQMQRASQTMRPTINTSSRSLSSL